jgi:putative peptide zinc metalloprotease protein
MSHTIVETPPLPAHPALAAGVLVHPPVEEGAPWLVEREGRRYFRVGADMARLARSLDGHRDVPTLALVLGHPWSVESVEGALRQLQGMDLLDDGQVRTVRPRRVAVVPPMSLQVTVVDPGRVLRRLARPIDLLSRRPVLAAYLLVAVAGLVALALQADAVRRLMSEPLPLRAFAIVFVGNFLATVLHELAHGAVLTHLGGTPRRMGFMLFYLVPAFFCDVSDGWRLPRNAMRVRVALAGIAAQLVVAGTLALGAPLVPDPRLSDTLTLLAVVVYLAGVVNVVPFVKFDGYLALMSHLDISDLRTKAMDDARASLARVLYGTEHERRLPGRRWVVPYGLGCLLFPLVLVGVVGLALWTPVFSRLGYVGALVNLSLVGVVVLGMAKEVGRVHRLAGRSARVARRGRMVAVDVVLLGLALLLLTQVQVTRTVSAGYRVEGDAAVLYVAGREADLVRPGQPVELRSNGLVLRPRVGSATVADEPSTTAEIEMTEFSPVELDTRISSRVTVLVLSLGDPPDQDHGVAEVRTGRRSLGGWLWSTYAEPVL